MRENDRTVKRFVLASNTAGKAQVKPKSCNQDRRKNDAFALSVTQSDD